MSDIELPDGAEPLTIGWWHNRLISRCRSSNGECMQGHCRHREKWAKVLSHKGKYEDLFKPGTSAPKPDWDCSRGKDWEGDGKGHQAAIILGYRYGYFVVDCDDNDLYMSEAGLAKYITREHAMSTRGDRWHALVWVPPQLRHLWPDRNVPGADIKGAWDGFVPVPGSIHYSGEPYQPVPGAKALGFA